MRLEVNRLDAALDETITEVVQARKGLLRVGGGAVGERGPGPEDLSDGRGARPHDRVDVVRARLLGP